MAKLVDAPSSGGGAARCAGSNPVPGTGNVKALIAFAYRAFLFQPIVVLSNQLLFSCSKKFSNRKLFVSSNVFNIITRKTLLDYCKKYPEAAVALQNWYYELVKSEFKNFNELKKVYGNASLVADDRLVFNIMGNKYRLVVRIVFEFKAIQIKWFGTHGEYDKIDVSTISYKKK